MPSMAPRDSAISFADLLDLLGFAPDEFVSIGHYVDNGSFRTAVRAPSDAPSYVAGLPADANVFYGINPTAGPARENAGRGTEDKITRLATLPLTSTVKPGACPTRDVAVRSSPNCSILLGSRPTATVDSVTVCTPAGPSATVRSGDIGPGPRPAEALGPSGRPCRRPPQASRSTASTTCPGC